MHGRVAGRAVAIPRQGQIVKRRRLRAERVCDAGARMAGETELIDARPGEHLGIRRAVRLMTGETVSGGAGDMIENEGAAFLGVTVQARQLADPRQGHGLSFAVVWVVAVETGHSAAIQAMRVRLVLERCGLIKVTGSA